MKPVVSQIVARSRSGLTLSRTAWLLGLASAVASRPALAAPGYTVTTSGNGILGNIASTLQSLANFASTTLGEFVVVGGFIIAACLWAFAPRSGAVGYAFRAVIAAIFVFNLTAIISWFTYS